MGEAQLPGPCRCLSSLRVKHNSESERRSPSSEDDKEERESTAEIQNLEDYKEIFQPKSSISELDFTFLDCFGLMLGKIFPASAASAL